MALFEEIVVAYMAKKFPSVYGFRIFISVLTRAVQRILA
jgi:hypothetical protein